MPHFFFIETALQFELKGVVFVTADCKRVSQFLSRSLRLRLFIFDAEEKTLENSAKKGSACKWRLKVGTACVKHHNGYLRFVHNDHREAFLRCYIIHMFINDWEDCLKKRSDFICFFSPWLVLFLVWWQDPDTHVCLSGPIWWMWHLQQHFNQQIRFVGQVYHFGLVSKFWLTARIRRFNACVFTL